MATYNANLVMEPHDYKTHLKRPRKNTKYKMPATCIFLGLQAVAKNKNNYENETAISQLKLPRNENTI